MADLSQGGIGEPASYAEVVTPDDDDVISTSRALYIGATGDLTVTMNGGGNVTFVGVPAGMILPIRVTKVLATGTDADSIINLY